MATVRKRKWTHNGESKEAWVVNYTDQTGGRRLKTFEKKKDADKYRIHVESELERGTHVAPSQTITVNDALTNWLDHCEQRAKAGDGMRQMTVYNARNMVDNHLRPAFGPLLLTDLTVVKVQAWLDDRAYKDGLSQAHLKHLHGFLRSALRRAFNQGYVGRNILTEGHIRIPGKQAVRKEIPTKDEVRELLAMSGEVLGPGGVARYLRPLVFMAVFTGMRQGELRALLWEDVDLDARVVHVRRGADQFGRSGDPKSRAAFRDIPLAPVVVTELKKWKLASQARNPSGLVFIGNRGKIVQPSSIQQAFARLQNRVFGKVEGGTVVTARAKYHFHSLRHFAASVLIESGLPPKRIQAIMGHSSISMTFDRYGHLFEDQGALHDAMAKIADGLS